jgi:MFS family permease
MPVVISAKLISLETIGKDLDNLVPVGWIAASWSAASGVSFALAGEFSDIWGRKVVVLGGQVFTIVGAVSTSLSILLRVRVLTNASPADCRCHCP